MLVATRLIAGGPGRPLISIKAWMPENCPPQQYEFSTIDKSYPTSRYTIYFHSGISLLTHIFVYKSEYQVLSGFVTHTHQIPYSFYENSAP